MQKRAASTQAAQYLAGVVVFSAPTRARSRAMRRRAAALPGLRGFFRPNSVPDGMVYRSLRKGQTDRRVCRIGRFVHIRSIYEPLKPACLWAASRMCVRKSTKAVWFLLLTWNFSHPDILAFPARGRKTLRRSNFWLQKGPLQRSRVQGRRIRCHNFSYYDSHSPFPSGFGTFPGQPSAQERREP